VPFSLRREEFHSTIGTMVIEHCSHEPSDKLFVCFLSFGLILQ